MNNIVWITGDSFLDVDIPIIHNLASELNITWYIILSRKRVVSYTKEELLDDFKAYNIDIRFIEFDERLRSFNTFKKMFKLIRSLRIPSRKSIVYCDYLGLPFFFPLAYIFLKKKNIIYAAHDVVDHLNIPNRSLISLYKSFIFKRFNNFHLFSRTQHDIFKLKYPLKKTFYSPLFLKDFGEPSLNKNDNKVQFLFFGSIRENKGLEYLLEAGNLLYKKYGDAFIIKVAGRCNNWERYESIITENDAFDLQIESVLNEDIPNLYAKSHYLVLPYLDVTQSGPLLISYNYNVPVIASQLGGFEEYIEDGVTGFLFETKNSSKLFEKMSLAIEQVKCGEYTRMQNHLGCFVDDNISVNSISSKYKSFFESLNNF